MKKLLGICLVLLALMGLSVTAYAMEDVTVSVTTEATQATAGDEVTFVISVTKAEGVDSCTLEFDFSEDVFAYVSTQWLVEGTAEDKCVTWDALTTVEGDLAKFTLRVKPGSAAAYEVGCTVSFTEGDETPMDGYKGKSEVSIFCTHDFSGKVEAEEYLSTAGDCQNKKQYFESCVHCGEKGEKLFTGKTFGDHVYDSDCDTECNVCGRFKAANHQAGEELFSDETGHWLECTLCLEKVEFAAHVPGPEATADEHQLCTVCGYVLAVSDEHKCEYSSKWYFDDKNHWHECSCMNKSDLKAHSWTVVQEDASAILYQCTVCNAVKQDSIPDEIPDDPTTGPTETTPTQQTQKSEVVVTEKSNDVLVIFLLIMLVLSLVANGVLVGLLLGRQKKPNQRRR